MRPLPLPPIAPADLLTACIGGVTDAATSGRLNGAAPTLLATANLFHGQAGMRALHTIPRSQATAGATRPDLEGMYKEQMSKARGSARAYYDLIRNSAEHGKCPLCGIGTVRTLDHHLPKSQYPDLSVCPYNLVPACDFCQAGKLAKYPATAGDQTLHPYYDNYGDEQWIWATLNAAGPLSLVFHAAAPVAWSAVDQQRVLRHFVVFKLDHVYAVNAGDELSTLRGHLVRLSVGGPQPIQDYLNDERARWAVRPNSWQHVTYSALAADAWFVNGGYLSIPV